MKTKLLISVIGLLCLQGSLSAQSLVTSFTIQGRNIQASIGEMAVESRPNILEGFWNTIQIQDLATSNTQVVDDLGVDIFPNPAQYALYIDTKNSKNTYKTVQILDSRGAFVQESNLDRATRISLSGLSNGVYFLKLYQVETSKFYIKKLIITK